MLVNIINVRKLSHNNYILVLGTTIFNGIVPLFLSEIIFLWIYLL